jgi:hypothetical protein
MPEQYRVLGSHFAAVKRRLEEYSKHFDIAKHGDVKGYGREALVQEFLKTHLPSQVEYLSGEILDPSDNRSGQVDVILQSRRYPHIPLVGNLHLAFSDAVVAIIEVKSDLTSQHLENALGQFAKVKALMRSVTLSYPFAAPLTSIPCLIFAFKGPTKNTLIDSISAYALKNELPLPRFAPDMTVVLDREYYVCRNDGWQFPVVPVPGAFFRDWAGLPHETLVGMYNYLNNVIQAHDNERCRLPLNDYFDKTVLSNTAGNGSIAAPPG